MVKFDGELPGSSRAEAMRVQTLSTSKNSRTLRNDGHRIDAMFQRDA